MFWSLRLSVEYMSVYSKSLEQVGRKKRIMKLFCFAPSSAGAAIDQYTSVNLFAKVVGDRVESVAIKNNSWCWKVQPPCTDSVLE